MLTKRTRDVVPHYNCHGMTFAARRTAISASSEVQKILNEDGYVEVKENCLIPGDIMLYIAPDGDIEHSATVVAITEKPFMPIVVSKWGIGFEAMHAANHCPYNMQHARYYRIIQ